MDVARTKTDIEWWPITGWPGWPSWGSQQARYCGRARTKFQLYLAATVANLALLPDKIRPYWRS